MNLLYICDEYPPGKNGGIGSAVQVLARELVRQGHRVFVAGLYTYQYGQADQEIDQGVQVWRFRYGLQLPDTHNGFWYKMQRNLPAPLRARLNGHKAFTNFMVWLQALIAKEAIDLLEIPDWNTFAYDIGFQLRWPALPVPMLVKSHGSHTYFADELGQQPNAAWAATDAALYARADGLAAVSAYTAARNKVLFDTARSISILHNGIQLPEPQSGGNRQKAEVLFSGTLTYKKGCYSLMQAWNMVHKKHPQARLTLYGKGAREDLEALLLPGTQQSVRFMGHQPRELLFTALQSATLAVFPSYSETFGLAPVEAMAFGCPTIFTRRSCGPEIVRDGETGLLVAPEQPEEIAAAICRLLEDETLRQQLGAAGCADVSRRFDIRTVARQHIEHYRQLTAAFRQQHS